MCVKFPCPEIWPICPNQIPKNRNKYGLTAAEKSGFYSGQILLSTFCKSWVGARGSKCNRGSSLRFARWARTGARGLGRRWPMVVGARQRDDQSKQDAPPSTQTAARYTTTSKPSLLQIQLGHIVDWNLSAALSQVMWGIFLSWNALMMLTVHSEVHLYILLTDCTMQYPLHDCNSILQCSSVPHYCIHASLHNKVNWGAVGCSCWYMGSPPFKCIWAEFSAARTAPRQMAWKQTSDLVLKSIF